MPPRARRCCWWPWLPVPVREVHLVRSHLGKRDQVLATFPLG